MILPTFWGQANLGKPDLCQQEGAVDRAEQLGAKMAEIRAGFRKEQLTVQAKIQGLERELQAARSDVKLAEKRRGTAGSRAASLEAGSSDQMLQ